MNWTALASIATLLAVIVALIPHYKDLFHKTKKRKIIIAKLRLILEDLMFLTDTTKKLQLDFLSKFHDELDAVATGSFYELPLEHHKKLLDLLYLMRIYDESEEALESLQKRVIEAHDYFSKLDIKR
jgi:hypothetical protein